MFICLKFSWPELLAVYGACMTRPLRLKLIVTDIEGEEASLVMEHVNRGIELEKEKEGDIAFLFFDDWDGIAPNKLEILLVNSIHG